MQVHIKQIEIEAAIKLYIAQQGINLVSKVTEVTFTSGRKDNGLSAEITIEDAVVLSVVSTGKATVVAYDSVEETAPPEEDPTPKAPISLFK